MQPGLKWFRYWLSLGLIILSVVLVACFVPPEPHEPVQTYNDKVWHALSYALLMCWFGQLLIGRWHFGLLIALTLMGIGVENLQPLTGRSYEVADMLANFSGAFLVWVMLRFTPFTRLFFYLERIYSSASPVPGLASSPKRRSP